MNLEIGKGLDDISALDEEADGLTTPLALLQTLVDGGVRATFKGHDNRFGRASMDAGESILGAARRRNSPGTRPGHRGAGTAASESAANRIPYRRHLGFRQ